MPRRAPEPSSSCVEGVLVGCVAAPVDGSCERDPIDTEQIDRLRATVTLGVGDDVPDVSNGAGRARTFSLVIDQIAAEEGRRLVAQQYARAVGQQAGERERTGGEGGGQQHRSGDCGLGERASQAGHDRRRQSPTRQPQSAQHEQRRSDQDGERGDDGNEREALGQEVGMGHLGADLADATDAIETGKRDDHRGDGNQLPWHQSGTRSTSNRCVDERTARAAAAQATIKNATSAPMTENSIASRRAAVSSSADGPRKCTAVKAIAPPTMVPITTALDAVPATLRAE